MGSFSFFRQYKEKYCIQYAIKKEEDMDINEAARELSGISGKNMTECLTMMLEKAKIIGMEKMLNEIYVMSREYYLSTR